MCYRSIIIIGGADFIFLDGAKNNSFDSLLLRLGWGGGGVVDHDNL